MTLQLDQSQSLSSGLWILDLRLWTWIWDLDKVMKGHGRWFADTRLTFQVRKVMCGGGGDGLVGWWPVGL